MQPTDPRVEGSPVRSGSSGSGTIGRRVARILALPAVVVLLLLGLLAAGQVQEYRDSATTSHSVGIALGVQDLVRELQTERGVTSGVLGGNTSFVAELAPARARVDEQRNALSDLVDGDSAADAPVGEALDRLEGLATVRAATDAGTQDRAAAFTFFTGSVADLVGADVGLENAADAELRRGVGALQALQGLTEATSQERAFLNGVFSAGGFAPGEFVQFASMRAERLSALARFERLATPTERTSVEYVFDTGAAQTTESFEQVAIDAADGRHIVVNPQSWWSGLTTVLDDLSTLEEHVGSTIQVRAHELQQGAAQRIGLLVGFVLLCVVGSVYLAALASRSITRPLAELAAEADSVAAERLPAAVRTVQQESQGMPVDPPEPVKVPPRATQEIRSVAGALERLQAAAYGLATEQAVQRRDTIESMANLGRRNQNLIRRQLGFISSLEREEADPNALANLFELDHLATRMRRNAASLLVLVDAGAPRQWSNPVPVSDVVRAAVSEVEEYRRVSIRRVDEALVSGTAIGPVSHLLSELIENGLTFSPPDTDVEVQGRKMPDGYLIAITDQGVGMGPDDLREANARLRGEGDFIAAPTRFLGHFVVGKLARRTGVTVELLPSPVTGVTARVMLPQNLLDAAPIAQGTPRLSSGSGPRSVGGPGDGRLVVTNLPAPTPPDGSEFTDAPAAPAAAAASEPWPDATETAPPAGLSAVPSPSPRPDGSEPRPDEDDDARTDAAAAVSIFSIGDPGTTGGDSSDSSDDGVPTSPGSVFLVDHAAPNGDLSSDGDSFAADRRSIDGTPFSDTPFSDTPFSDTPFSDDRFADDRFADEWPPRPAAAEAGSWTATNGAGTNGTGTNGTGAPGTTGEDDVEAAAPQPGDREVPPAPVPHSPWTTPARTYAADPDRTPGNGVPLPPRAAAELFTPASGIPGLDTGPRQTRNGLPKRVPRAQRPVSTQTGPHRVIDLDAAAARETVRVDDSPAQVGSRLTALRSGFERGRTARTEQEDPE